MSDAYGKGYYGTGSRPLTPGADQSAYDIGARHRQDEQFRRQQEQWRRMHEDQRRQQEKREADLRRNCSTDGAASRPAHLNDDGISFEGLLLFASLGGFTFIIVAIWNFLIGLAPSFGGLLATAIKFSPWVVGLVAIGVGIRIQKMLMKITAILLILALLFLGSAFAYGVYQGITGNAG